MSRFLDALILKDNFTYTENDAVALKTTNSALVDLFGTIGALRNHSNEEIQNKFMRAFAEDKLLATKMAFYTRDIRQSGLGERRIFRIIIKHLAQVYPEILRRNLQYIPLFGRYDDLYELIGTSVETDVWALIKEQWALDIMAMSKKQPVSLMAKWLKSINTSSSASCRLGNLTAKALKLSSSDYRKQLSKLRKYLNVVEVQMSNQQWNKIQYAQVPSRAMSIYRNAFKEHDEVRFERYLKKVELGEEKINSSALFPYDILENMELSSGSDDNLYFNNYSPVLDLQWKALPNYIEGNHNVLVVADTSGSMHGRPLCTSVGLAMYFAERNHGIFHNTFMTFSQKPQLVRLKGDTLLEKIAHVKAIVANTDLEAVYQLILDTALENNLSPEDMPKGIVVISDMEFDEPSSTGYLRETWHSTINRLYQDAGYEFPNIIYWNVDARNDVFQVNASTKGVQLVSGQSPAVFKAVMKNIGLSPYEAMVATLSDPIYDCITI